MLLVKAVVVVCSRGQVGESVAGKRALVLQARAQPAHSTTSPKQPKPTRTARLWGSCSLHSSPRTEGGSQGSIG